MEHRIGRIKDREGYMSVERGMDYKFIVSGNENGLVYSSAPAYSVSEGEIQHWKIADEMGIPLEEVLGGGWAGINFRDNSIDIGGESKDYGGVPLEVLKRFSPINFATSYKNALGINISRVGLYQHEIIKDCWSQFVDLDDEDQVRGYFEWRSED